MENKFIKCKSCGAELTEANKFCPNCGAKKENGFTKCNSCGAELTEADKFCPNCGAKRNGKKKKPLFKKWWFWLIIVLLIIGAIGSIGDDTATEPVPTTAPLISAPAAQEPVAPIEPATEEKSADKNEMVEAFKSSVEMVLDEYFDYVEAEGDETGVTVSVANDGLAILITQAKIEGYDETFPEWVSMKGSMLDLYGSIANLAKTMGLDDTTISLAVVNDLNHSNAFVMIIDGLVVYDYLAD